MWTPPLFVSLCHRRFLPRVWSTHPAAQHVVWYDTVWYHEAAVCFFVPPALSSTGVEYSSRGSACCTVWYGMILRSRFSPMLVQLHTSVAAAAAAAAATTPPTDPARDLSPLSYRSRFLAYCSVQAYDLAQEVGLISFGSEVSVNCHPTALLENFRDEVHTSDLRFYYLH